MLTEELPRQLGAFNTKKANSSIPGLGDVTRVRLNVFRLFEFPMLFEISN